MVQNSGLGLAESQIGPELHARKGKYWILMLYCRLSGKQESLSLPKYNLNIYMRSTVAAAAVQRKVQGVVSREVIREWQRGTCSSGFPSLWCAEMLHWWMEARRGFSSSRNWWSDVDNNFLFVPKSPVINISTLYSGFNKVQNSELGPDLNQTRKMVENWYSSPIYQDRGENEWSERNQDRRVGCFYQVSVCYDCVKAFMVGKKSLFFTEYLK